MKIILLMSTICSAFIIGCSSSSETTTTETTTIKAVVPEIHGIVPVVQEVVPIQSLPESTQAVLIEKGFEELDSVEVTSAETKTETGSIDAVIYKPVVKAKYKKPIAILNAKPKSPIQATQTKIMKNEVKKSFGESILDLARSFRITLCVLIIVLAVVMYLVRKYL